MTYKDIINAVLRRLREDTVSTWSGDLIDNASIGMYQQLIGDFINETKREVEDAHNWTVLRSKVAITTASGTRDYNLTNTNERVRVLSVYDRGTGSELSPIDDSYLEQAAYPSMTNNRPSNYVINGTASSAEISFYPTPDAVYNIDVLTVDPQDELTDATDTLSVTAMPVILGAWARAISERGEDGGSLSDMVFMQYQQALSDAIAQDSGRVVRETLWYSV